MGRDATRSDAIPDHAGPVGPRAGKRREMTDSLNEAEPVAQHGADLIRSLKPKGAVGHEADGRTFVFFATLKEDRVKRTATRELLERVFGGNVGSLVAHLIKDEQLSRTELDQLRRMLDQHGRTEPSVTQRGAVMWNSPETLMTSLAGIGLTWLVQSTALLTLGLAAGQPCEKSRSCRSGGHLSDHARCRSGLPDRVGDRDCDGLRQLQRFSSLCPRPPRCRLPTRERSSRSFRPSRGHRSTAIRSPPLRVGQNRRPGLSTRCVANRYVLSNPRLRDHLRFRFR